MADQPYDKSSKWLLKHHGKSLLQLAGCTDVQSCELVLSEVVQPRKLPDGLLKVRFRNRKELEYVLVEIATYPEERAHKQAFDDVVLTYLALDVVPEMLTVVLCPKGNAKVRGELRLKSRQGWTSLDFQWNVVRLWTLSAKKLFDTNDPGLIPWIPLTKSKRKPESILRECKEHIESRGTIEQQSTLLAVTQVLAGLKYTDPALMDLLGGKKAMLDSPVLRNLIAEQMHKMIEQALLARFSEVPLEITNPLHRIDSQEKLISLSGLAATCSSLEEFRQGVLAE